MIAVSYGLYNYGTRVITLSYGLYNYGTRVIAVRQPSTAVATQVSARSLEE